MSKPPPIVEVDETIVRDTAVGDLSVAIDVSKGKNATYLRMGDAPNSGEAGRSLDVMYAFNGVASVGHYSHGFIHGKKQGDLDALVDEGGWYDHTEGSRVTTTNKDKVEIIGGDYKLIACNGDAGIDFSGGHLRMWSKNTPGTLTKVLQGEEEGATEVIQAKKRYSMRFVGGHYDESWTGGTFEAYFGKKSEHSMGGAPEGSTDLGSAELDGYREEIHAKNIVEIFKTTKGHTEEVDTLSYSEKRLVKKLLSTEEDAQDILHESTATLTLEESKHVGLAWVWQDMDPCYIGERKQVGLVAVSDEMNLDGITETYDGPNYSQTINTKAYSQEYAGWGPYRDTCKVSTRNDFYVGGFIGRETIAGVALQFDGSAIRIDTIASPLWVEAHGAGKVEMRAGVMLAVGKMETKNSLLDFSLSMLHVLA